MSLVLVVDDHEDTAEVLAKFVRRLGYEVRLAGNGKEAMTVLRSEPVRLVLLDVMMPEMSGLQLMKAMHEDDALRAIPVVIHSAYCDPVTQAEAVRMGAVAYVLKSALPLDKLKQVIETYAGAPAQVGSESA